METLQSHINIMFASSIPAKKKKKGYWDFARITLNLWITLRSTAILAICCISGNRIELAIVFFYEVFRAVVTLIQCFDCHLCLLIINIFGKYKLGF